MTEIKTNRDIAMHWQKSLRDDANAFRLKLSPVQSCSSLPSDNEYRLLVAELEATALSLKNLLRKDADLIVQADSCFQKDDFSSAIQINANLKRR
jgi:hypothetical protein